jgi:outer membrane protein assembly factor BamB
VVVDEARLYVGTEHSVWAFDRGDDRHSAWDEPGDGRRLAVGSEAVVATGRDRITGFDRESGEVRWAHHLDAVAYSVLVGDRTAYAGFRDEVVAFDLASGEVRWSIATNGRTFLGFGGGDRERLLVGSRQLRAFAPRGPLRGVLADSPRQRWEADSLVGETHPVDAGDYGTLVGSVACLRSESCGLAAVGDDGTVDWRVELGNNASRVAFDGERAYVVSIRYGESEGNVNYSDDTTLHAIDPASGDELWTFDRSGWFSSPVVAGGVVYVGERGRPNGDGNLYALEAATGERAWTYERTEGVNALAAVGGVLYAATNGGRVLALA